MTASATGSESGPFSSLTVLWMVVVGGIAALLFVVLLAYAPRLRDEADGRAHAMSKSAVGYAGLARLLGDEGVPVVISRNPHPEREARRGLLVLTPELGSDPKAMARLGGRRLELIVLPKWLVAEHPEHRGWVTRLGLLPADLLSSQLLNAFDGHDHIEQAKGASTPRLVVSDGFSKVVQSVPAGRIESLQTIVGPDQGWISVVGLDPAHAILIRQRDQPVYILSDPDLLNNQGLSQLANARGATALINALRKAETTVGAEPPGVVFDLTLAGFTRTRSLLGLAFEPPFLAATLCALATVGLMGLHAAGRFGPPLRQGAAFALGKRALADNSAALVRLARREHTMGGGYANLTRSLAARAVGAPRDLNDDQMDALLDRLGRVRRIGRPFSDLERQARDARDVPALMAAARALYQWRLEMTHERR